MQNARLVLILVILLLASCTTVPQMGKATAQGRMCTDTDNTNTFELAYTEPPVLTFFTRPDTFTLGAVSTIDDRGRLSRQEDSCFAHPAARIVVLLEKYCDAESKPQEQIIRCPKGCKDGACIGAPAPAAPPVPTPAPAPQPTPTKPTPAPTPPIAPQTPAPSPSTCVDSDNGKTFDTQGRISSTWTENTPKSFAGQDICSQESSGTMIAVPNCPAGQNCYVSEYFCDTTLNANQAVSINQPCTDGCKDGACLPKPACSTNQGNPCNCGGTIGCDGSCSKSECPTGQTCTNGQCTTPCSTQQGQACNRNACGGSGTVQCDGSCSAPAPFAPTNLGSACNRNQCGGSGTVDCSGTCNSGPPFVPSNLGQACGCGGNIQCSGQCSNNGCPSGQVCQNGACGCVPLQGQACGNYGTYDCAGNCANQCPSGQVRANDGVCTAPCGRCLVAPAQNCDQACQNLRQGYTSGTCAAPTSTNVGACCSCYKPPTPTYTAPVYTAPASNCRTGSGTCRMQDGCPAYMHKVWTNGINTQGCVNVYSIINTRVCGTTTGGVQCDGSSSTSIYRDQCVCP